MGALVSGDTRDVRAHARRSPLAAIALGALSDHPVETLVGWTGRGPGRCPARNAALSRPGRGPRHDERFGLGRELARGANRRTRTGGEGAPRAAAHRAHSALNAHLRRDHVSAETPEDDFNP